MRLGRSLKLRDLHTLTVVAELGSMAKAAAFLSITQPAVSQAIADLERFAGIRLLDRGPRGVVLTVAGEAMVARGRQALDTLDLGMRDIAFLTDGGRGVVRVGADMAFIAGGLMADIIGSRATRSVLHTGSTGGTGEAWAAHAHSKTRSQANQVTIRIITHLSEKRRPASL
jgi:DNA-binding transcriptional LysR family regulator